MAGRADVYKRQHFECGALLLYNSQVIALRDDVLRTLPECREVQLADCRTSLAGTLLDSVLRLLSPLIDVYKRQFLGFSIMSSTKK